MPYAAIIFDDDYLAHHGVKGQRWGVRNDKTTGSGIVPSKKKMSKYQIAKNAKKSTHRRILGTAAAVGAGAAAIGAGHHYLKGLGNSFGSSLAIGLAKKSGKPLSSLQVSRLKQPETKHFILAGASILAGLGLSIAARKSFNKANKIDKMIADDSKKQSNAKNVVRNYRMSQIRR